MSRRLKQLLIATGAAFTLTAFQNCGEVGFDSQSVASSEKGTDEGYDEAHGQVHQYAAHQDECRKLESLNVGQEISIGEQKITIAELKYKGGATGGERIGFRLSSSSNQISFLVKAGREGYEGTGLSWENPNGNDGPRVHAISHVTLCIGVPPEEILDPSLPAVRE